MTDQGVFAYPMIADSSPDLKHPDTPFSTVFFSGNQTQKKVFIKNFLQNVSKQQIQ
jgi:hypothetical protein